MGKISQIIGPVVDVRFELSDSEEIKLPAINDALYVNRNDGQEVFLEVQQHIGENIVRTVAMESTDGLIRVANTLNELSATLDNSALRTAIT
jgi:F-type H+-transporting ATPase subunit beta